MRQLEGREIEFSNGVELFDAYPESGMRATVFKVVPYPEKGLFEVFLDYSKFEDHNLRLETIRFIKDGGYKCYREIDVYEAQESYCVSEDFDFFKILSFEKDFLFDLRHIKMENVIH